MSRIQVHLVDPAGKSAFHFYTDGVLPNKGDIIKVRDYRTDATMEEWHIESVARFNVTRDGSAHDLHHVEYSARRMD